MNILFEQKVLRQELTKFKKAEMLNYKELSKLTGVSVVTLNNFIKGATVSNIVFVKLCDFYRKTILAVTPSEQTMGVVYES